MSDEEKSADTKEARFAESRGTISARFLNHEGERVGTAVVGFGPEWDLVYIDHGKEARVFRRVRDDRYREVPARRARMMPDHLA